MIGRAAFVIACVVACSAAGLAQEPDPVAAFRVRLESARQQMDADLPAAIEALDRLAAESLEVRKSRVLSDAERPLHRELFLLRARGHLQLLANEKVEASFRELLRIDPFLTVPLAPREQQILDALVKREGGFLEIASRERDSRIFVNGVEAGQTGEAPARFALIAGDYEIRLEKEGFEPAVTRTTIPPGLVVTLQELAPERRVPPAAFLTDRQDVEVSADDVPIGRTARLSALRGQVSPEEYAALDRALSGAGLDASAAGAILLRQPPVDRPIKLTFRRDCYVEQAQTITITSESLARLSSGEAVLWFGEASAVRMQADTGTLRVTSTPSDADVFVDDQLVGRTPFEREVCAGPRRVRLRHRIGSYSAAAAVVRGRTEVVDAVLKPGIGFLGAVEIGDGAVRPLPELTASLDRALASAVRTYRLSVRRELPPEGPRWTETSTGELVAASDRGDAATVRKLLRLAGDSYEAPLLVCAVRQPPAAGSPTAPSELRVFWVEHEAMDRAEWRSPAELETLLARLDAPADASDVVYRNGLGIQAVDTAFPGDPLMIVTVDAGSPAVTAGLKVGDMIVGVDGAGMSAAQLAERTRQKRAGDLIALRIAAPAGAPRDVPLSIQRKPALAPVFDQTLFGNALIAKLTAASLLATTAADRDLLAFNLAVVRMRFGAWRAALDLFQNVGTLPAGTGVGPGAALVFRARCHEQLGERDKALALYKEATAFQNETLTDDGASVAAIARRRLVVLSALP